MTIIWGLPGVCQLPSTFWSITLQPPGVDQATISHIKGDIHTFHMRHSRLICSKSLHQNQSTIRNTIIALVVGTQQSIAKFTSDSSHSSQIGLDTHSLGSEIMLVRGLVRFVSAVAYHICLNLTATFSQPHTNIFPWLSRNSMQPAMHSLSI